MKTRKKTAKTRARGSRSAPARIVAQAALPSRFGRFTILGVEGRSPEESAVVVRHSRTNGSGKPGKSARATAPVVRIHSQCLTGDVLASERCDCRAQLELSLRKIAAAPEGLLLYLPQEGRGIGLMNKLRAYQLQDGGMDTVEANERLGFAADSRDYRFCAQALRLLGVRRVRLLSNNPDKVKQLERYGVKVVERLPCQPRGTKTSRDYMRTKQSKMGHLLSGL